MRDKYGREINYLRISVTDKCNLRCRYCMPEEGVEKKCHSDILPIEDLAEIAAAAARLGVTKIRLTGGEPLVRKGITQLVREISAIPEIEDLAMTTNGILLPELAQGLKEAGLRRLNISLDTLNAEKYRAITRLGSLDSALAGIRAAVDWGFEPLKINTVLVGGFNDDEIPELVELTCRYPIELRFIELMPIGQPVFPPEAYIDCGTVLQRMPQLQPLESSGTARLYQIPGAPGKVGLIEPLSNHFCGSCNRIRLTADGHLKPCLHSAEEINIAGLHGDELLEALRTAISHKPAQHGLLTCDHHSESVRNMNGIGG